jgi:hypothetical protein
LTVDGGERSLEIHLLRLGDVEAPILVRKDAMAPGIPERSSIQADAISSAAESTVSPVQA